LKSMIGGSLAENPRRKDKELDEHCEEHQMHTG